MQLACALRAKNSPRVKSLLFQACLFLTVFSGSVTVCSHRTNADEEYTKFLTKLKDLGNQRRDPNYFQIAFDYLNYLETTDLVSDAIKKSLSYEKGTLLISSAKFIKNRKQRDSVMVTGKTLLETFIAENEFHPYVSAAKNELANLLIITARQKIKEAAGKNETLVESARSNFVEAFNIVKATRVALAEELKKIPAKPTETTLKQRRTEFENEFLRARLMLPSIQEELSDTYAENSDNRRTSLQLAAKEFADVNKDYRSRTAGQLAWMYRGRCLKKLGEFKEALAVFREIFEQPDSPEFRELKRMTLEMAFPIWLNPKAVENGFIEAVKVTDPIIEALSPQESRSANWLRVRLDLAKAYRNHHEYLLAKQNKTQDDKVLATKRLQQSNTAARFVAASNSEIKREAQKLLVEWGARAKVDPKEVAPPRDFVEARDRASAVLSDLEIVKKTVQSLEKQIGTNPPNKDELVKQLGEATQSMIDTPKKAIEFLQMAISFSTEKTPIEDINLIRYQMCFCYYTMGENFRAALIGEFLLDRFPSVNGSRESAAIAMYSYWDLYRAADPASKKFEQQKVDTICSKITSVWPNAAESAEAFRMLIAIAMESGQLDRAVELLDKIPAESTHRASIELNTGQALWVNYLKLKKAATDSGTLAAQTAKINGVRAKAEALLVNGITSVTAKNINLSKAKSVLSLAKIYAEKKEGTKTLELMEHPEFGLLSLVKTKNPAAQDARFRLDVFRTALKGYVHSIAPGSDAGAIATTMEKASSMMSDLKAVTAEMENGDKILVSLYYAFANDIKSKMDSLKSVAAKKKFSSGLSDFLEGAGNNSTDFQVIMWAASTLIKVADSFAEQSEKSEATSMYQAAVNVMGQIESRKIQVTAENKLAVLRNHGKALAGQGDYEKAIPKFVQYLSVKPTTLDVQVDAALALQNWGEKVGGTKNLAAAINGGGEVIDAKTKKKKKVIWGWGRLSTSIANLPQFKRQFLVARYNLAKARLIYHKIKPNSRLMDLAIKDIDVAKRKYPDLGGPRMKAQYDQLIEDINAAR